MRGGHRAGAGRKQGFPAKNAEEARRIFSEMIMGEIKPIAKALIAKAKKGDIMAARELFDRAFGKASQTTEILSGPEPITAIYFDSAFKGRKSFQSKPLVTQ